MGFVILYLLFAFAIGGIATLTLARPAISSVLNMGIENTISQNVPMAYFASFCIFTLIAPALVFVLIINDMHQRFYQVLADNFQKA